MSCRSPRAAARIGRTSSPAASPATAARAGGRPNRPDAPDTGAEASGQGARHPHHRSASGTRPRAGATTSTGTSSSTTRPEPCAPGRFSMSAFAVAPAVLTSVRPLWAVEGGRVTLEGTGFPVDPGFARRARRRAAGASRLGVADRADASSFPPASTAARRRSASTRCRARRPTSRSARRSPPACTRSTARRSIATATSTSPSAARAASRRRSRSSSSGRRHARAVRQRISPIRRRSRSIRDGGCTCPAVSTAACYRIEPRRPRHDRRDRSRRRLRPGLRTDGTLFVGDRSGTILRVARRARARCSRRCRPAWRRFIWPSVRTSALYVTAPTLGSARRDLSHSPRGRCRRSATTASAGRRGSPSTPRGPVRRRRAGWRERPLPRPPRRARRSRAGAVRRVAHRPGVRSARRVSSSPRPIPSIASTSAFAARCPLTPAVNAGRIPIAHDATVPAQADLRAARRERPIAEARAGRRRSDHAGDRRRHRRRHLRRDRHRGRRAGRARTAR